jgi:DNA-binding NarL/FixJ family response regulator
MGGVDDHVDQRSGRLEAVEPDEVTVVIIDDHDVVASGLAALLNEQRGLSVVATAGTVAEGVEVVERRAPDVVLVDYRLPDGTGADATRRIRVLDPRPAVVMVTAVADRRALAQALDAGCSGFVSKSADRDELVAAVRAAANDDSYFTRDVLKHLVHLHRYDHIDGEELSDREIEVLQLTADGLSPDEVAQRLYLSPHTVKNHLRHAMAKLDAHTKLDAVVKAVRARLITID